MKGECNPNIRADASERARERGAVRPDTGLLRA